MTEEFTPYLMETPDASYRVDDLHNAYADAWEAGIWVKEFGGTPKGFMAAAGSLYTIQELEHHNPGLDIDVQELTLGDCIEMSLPGGGTTREEAVLNAIQAFKDSDLWERHQMMHALAKETSHD